MEQQKLENKWISIKDGIPNIDKPVLVLVKTLEPQISPFPFFHFETDMLLASDWWETYGGVILDDEWENGKKRFNRVMAWMSIPDYEGKTLDELNKESIKILGKYFK